MSDLREQLQQCLHGRVCLMGIGNVLYGDDAFGVRLAEALLRSGIPGVTMDPDRGAEFLPIPNRDCIADFQVGRPSESPRSAGLETRDTADLEVCATKADRILRCIVAGTNPERLAGQVAQRGFDHLVFLDAVEFGGLPGSAILLSSEQMLARFPQVSTHKLSLGLLAKWIEANGTTRAWLLGVQPESLAPSALLSPRVQVTLELLARLLCESFEEVTA